jgi:pentatricopeptide repeat protein
LFAKACEQKNLDLALRTYDSKINKIEEMIELMIEKDKIAIAGEFILNASKDGRYLDARLVDKVVTKMGKAKILDKVVMMWGLQMGEDGYREVMDSAVKLGLFGKAKEIYERMVIMSLKPSLDSCYWLLENCLKHSKDEVLPMAEQMLSLGIRFDLHTFNLLFRQIKIQSMSKRYI